MADIVGTWSLTTDWECEGSPTGSFSQTFNADGTWTTTPFAHSGRWYQVEALAVWTFDDTPNLVYAANVSGSWVSGVQGYATAGGMKGCFGGHRSAVPAAAEPAKAVAEVADPAIGP
jgi:hypothetical protein